MGLTRIRVLVNLIMSFPPCRPSGKTALALPVILPRLALHLRALRPGRNAKHANDNRFLVGAECFQGSRATQPSVTVPNCSFRWCLSGPQISSMDRALGDPMIGAIRRLHPDGWGEPKLATEKTSGSDPAVGHQDQ